MASPPVRHASVFYKGKRIAKMQNAKYTINTNDSQEQADDDTYFTDGKTTVSLSCNVIVPVPGINLTVVEDALQHKTVDLTVALLNGKIHSFEARSKTLDFDTDVAAGSLKGAFEWMGKAPKVT